MSNSTQHIKKLNIAINNLDDKVLLPLQQNLDGILEVLNEQVTTNGDSIIDPLTTAMLNKFTVNTANAFTNYLLPTSVDGNFIITPYVVDTTNYGIYFNFFIDFATFNESNSLCQNKYNNYMSTLPLFNLTTNNFLKTVARGTKDTENKSIPESITGVVYTGTEQTLNIYNEYLKIKNSLDTLMNKKKEFVYGKNELDPILKT